jgi:hypothetical protein
MIFCGTHPTYNSHITSDGAHVYSLSLLEKACEPVPMTLDHRGQWRGLHLPDLPDAAAELQNDARAASRLRRLLHAHNPSERPSHLAVFARRPSVAAAHLSAQVGSRATRHATDLENERSAAAAAP